MVGSEVGSRFVLQVGLGYQIRVVSLSFSLLEIIGIAPVPLTVWSSDLWHQKCSHSHQLDENLHFNKLRC